MSFSYFILPTIRLETIRGSINIFKTLIKIFPGKEISLIWPWLTNLINDLDLLTLNKTRDNQWQYQHLQAFIKIATGTEISLIMTLSDLPYQWSWPTYHSQTRDNQGQYQHLQGPHQDFSLERYQPDNDLDWLTLQITLTYLPTLRLETIRGSINIYRAYIKISPWNDISLIMTLTE